MKIECFHGVDEKLYRKVVRLVMDPGVLRENNNYSFKTSENYRWAVASERKAVVGFMPVEYKDSGAVINNYYVCKGNGVVLDALVQAVLQQEETAGSGRRLSAVVLNRDIEVFRRNHFEVVRRWKQYVKMQWQLRSKKD